MGLIENVSDGVQPGSPAADDPGRRVMPNAVRIGIIAAVVAVVGAGTGVVVANVAAKDSVPAPAPVSSSSPSASATASALLPAEAAVAGEIDQALAATEWPVLTPSIEELYSTDRVTARKFSCTETVTCPENAAGLPSLVVFGDSTGGALLPTIHAGVGHDYAITDLSLANCESIDIAVRFPDAEFEQKCLQHRTDSIAEIQATKPAVVVIINSHGSAVLLKSLAQGAERNTEWGEALQRTVDQISPYAGKVVLVSPPPRGILLEECATPLSVPADCISTIPAIAEELGAVEAKATGANVSRIDTTRWYCNADGQCPSFAAGTPIKVDGVHMTKQWAMHMGPAFAEELAAVAAA